MDTSLMSLICHNRIWVFKFLKEEFLLKKRRWRISLDHEPLSTAVSVLRDCKFENLKSLVNLVVDKPSGRILG